MFRINVPQFAILKESMPAGNINLNTQLEFGYIADARRVSCEMKFDFSSEETAFITMILRCEFEVFKDDWDAFIKESTLTIPKSVLELFAVHTVGTARGIMFCRTEGTPFNYIIIPPINVSEMISSDLSANLETKE